MLPDVVEAGIAANHRRGLVLGLVHDLGAVGPIELRDGHKRGPVRGGPGVPAPPCLPEKLMITHPTL